MNFGKINFGLLLISVGVIFFMVNMGKLDHSVWPDLWRFWPVFLITWGIEILFHKSKLWVFTVLSPLVLMAVVWGVVYSHMHGEEGIPGLPMVTRRVAYQHAHFDVEKAADIKRLKVKLDVRGGALDLGAMEGGDKAFSADLEYRGQKPETKADLKDGVESVSVSAPGGIGNYQKKWDIRLSNTLPSEFELDANVSSAVLDFTDVPVEKLDIKSDVASLNLTLGARDGLTEASISANVASAKIHLPENCALHIEYDPDISSTNISDLGLKKNGKVFESDGYATAKCRISFDVHTDVASVRWSRG